MKLRGHHIFCTALFSGHGYDEAFTEKMGAVIAEWKNGEKAALLTAADEVCSACPNRLERGGCALGTKDVLRRDRAALKVLGLAPGREITWEQAGELLAHIAEWEFQEVCGDCRWQKEGLCTFPLLRDSAQNRMTR